MKITRDTLRADGLTVGESMDCDAAFLRTLGFDAKDGALTTDEQREQWIDECREAFLDSVDAFAEKKTGKPDQGWRDQDLPAIFKALDEHARKLFDRLAR